MKFLIAFAFLAMASAVSIEPVQLPEPAVPRYEVPDISPLIVPVEIMEEVRRAELSNAPEGSAVHFVDVATNVEAVNAQEEVQPAQEDVPFNANDLVVKFVDSPINEEAQDFAVKVVDSPINEETQDFADKVVDSPINEEAQDFAVKFVDSPINEEAQDFAVKVVDSPINEEAQDFAVKVVEAPLPVDEQTIQRESVLVEQEPLIDQPRLPGKQFSDPRLRGL